MNITKNIGRSQIPNNSSKRSHFDNLINKQGKLQ